MKHREMNKENAQSKRRLEFAFVDYTDAELIAFFEWIRIKSGIPFQAPKTQDLPGIAGKYNSLLACL